MEWEDIFQVWLQSLAPADQKKYQGRFREILFRLDGNLYGRIGVPKRSCGDLGESTGP